MMFKDSKTRQLVLRNSMLGVKVGALQNPNRTWDSIKSLVGFCTASRATVPLLILLNLGITLTLAYKLNVWLDEAYTLHTISQNAQFAFNKALRFEGQSPLYFVLLNLWRNLDSTFFFARLFSVICIALTIYVVAPLSRRFLKKSTRDGLLLPSPFTPS